MTLRAVLFDLFGTLVPRFPGGDARRDIPAMADALGVDRDALYRAWKVNPGRARDLGLLGSIEGDIRFAAEVCGAAPDEAALRDLLRRG